MMMGEVLLQHVLGGSFNMQDLKNRLFSIEGFEAIKEAGIPVDNVTPSSRRYN